MLVFLCGLRFVDGVFLRGELMRGVGCLKDITFLKGRANDTRDRDGWHIRWGGDCAGVVDGSS